MASLDTTLSILITAQDLASDPLNKVGLSAENLRSRLEAARDPLGALGDSAVNFSNRVTQTTAPIAEFGRQVLTATTGVAALGTVMAGLAYKEAAALETAQKQLQKVLSDSDPPAAAFIERMRELGLQYGQNSNELQASQTAFAQAGFAAADSAGLVKNALDLVVAGDVSAAEATDYLIRTLKGFGEDASKSAELTDILSAVSIKYATSTQQLGGAMADLAPIAQQMGFSLAETAGLVTPIIEVFGSGAEASEALKTGLLQLIDNSASVRTALSGIGVSQTDMNGQLRSGKDILLDVAKAFTTLDENTKLAVASQLAGVDQAGRLIKTFDGLTQYTEVTAVALESVGKTAGLVQERLTGAEITAKRTAEAFRQAAEVLGSQYRDAVTGVVDATGALARAFTETANAGSFEGLLQAARPQLQALENLFRQVAANLPAAFAQLDWSRLAASIGEAGTTLANAFQAVLGSIDLTTVDGLRQALQLVADGLATLIEFSSGFVDGLKPLFATFGEMARFLINNSEHWSRLAGEIAGVSQTITVILPAFANLLDKMFSIVGTVADLTLKIGLLTAGIGLLNAAGIRVLPMLGSLATAIGSLNVSTALGLSAFAGLSGVMLGLVGAAGAAGVAVGSGLSAAVESLTGLSIGSWAYDAVEGLKALVGASEEEALAAEALARDEKARAQQAIAAQNEIEEARWQEIEAAAAQRASNEALLAQNEEQIRTQSALSAAFRDMGLVWDAATGALIPLNAELASHVEASRQVQQALTDLGLDYKVISDQITLEGQRIIGTFQRITTDLTANADVIRAALDTAVDSVQTRAELEAIQAAYDQWASRTEASTTQVASAHALIQEKLQSLREQTDQTEQAFAKLGIESAADLDTVAQSAAAAFAAVKAGAETGAVPVQKVQEAFLAWAQAAVEMATATGKTVDPAVRAEAASLGLAKALQESIREAHATGVEFDALTAIYERQIDAAQRNTDVIDANLQSQRDQAQAAKDLAKAKGDEAAATQATIDLARIDAEIAAANAEAKAEEARLAREKASALELEALKIDGVSAAEREAIEAAKALAAETQAAAQAAEAHAEAAAAQADAVAKGTQSLYEQELAARNARVGVDQATESQDKMTVSVLRFRDATIAAFDQQGIATYQAAIKTVDTWLAQVRASIESLAGDTGLPAAVRSAELLASSSLEVSGYMDDTVQSVRDELVKAIADAQARMQAFVEQEREAAQDRQETLEDYRAEGDDLRQEELRHGREMAAIEERRTQAQAELSGQALRDALTAIDDQIAAENELHRIKMENLKKELNAQIESIQTTADTGNATRLQTELAGIANIKFDAANAGLQTMLQFLTQIESQSARTAQSLRNIEGAI